MESYPIKKLNHNEYPKGITSAGKPPNALWLKGDLPKRTFTLSIVGSRRHSSYAKECLEAIMKDLAGFDILIISGLAIGIDGLAHSLALEHNIATLAVPGSGLDQSVLYPRRHQKLANQILEAGGGLLSPFKPDQSANTWTFPARNSIMAAMADAVLVVEAQELSGTLITARLAADFNTDVLAIPASIFNAYAEGSLGLIKDGATMITSGKDIIDLYNIPKLENSSHPKPEENKLLKIITESEITLPSLLEKSNFPIEKLTTELSFLELEGKIIKTPAGYKRAD